MTQPSNTIRYYVWPDGSIVDQYDYSWEEFKFMGDDYVLIDVPFDVEFDTTTELYDYILLQAGII